MRGYGNVLIMEEGEVSLVVYPKEKLGNVLEIQRAALDQGERAERDTDVSKTTFMSTFSLRQALCPE